MIKINVGAFLTVIVSTLFPPLRPWVWSRFTKILYPYIADIDKGGRITLMNYGYAFHQDEAAPELDPQQEANRHSIQLYYKVATGVDLRGKTVLEVGSGRGGGAASLKSLLQIEKMQGLELCKEAVDFCSDFYRMEGLEFAAGTAEDLPFEDNSFDAVINVESSHCYPHIEHFFAETVRVLRPGGHFLYTDFRDPHEWEKIRSLMAESGLDVAKDEDITERVVEALEQSNRLKSELIEEVVPRATRSFFKSFAALEGMPMYKAFKKRKIEYRYFISTVSG